MSRFITLGFIIFALVFLTGCCCCTVPRTVVKFPETSVLISDDTGIPIKDVKFTLYLWSYPHHRYKSELTTYSDVFGKLSIAEETMKETTMPFMIHGVPYYEWYWVAQKPGYITLVGSIKYAEEGDRLSLDIVMTRGETLTIDSFEVVRDKASSIPYSEGQVSEPGEILPRLPANPTEEIEHPETETLK